MPILAENDTILEMVLKGRYNDELDTNNVFHYFVDSAAGATLQQIGAGLFFTLGDTGLLGVTAIVQKYHEIVVRQLDSTGEPTVGESYIIPATDGDGVVDTDSLPPDSCWTFKYIPVELGTRLGFKRFSGVPEGSQVDGRANGSGLAALANLAAGLAGDISGYTISGTTGLPDSPVGGSILNPIILHRVRHGDPLDEVDFSNVLTVVYDKIGSQDTRAFGRGS